MEARVAVLEEIAKSNKESLGEIKSELRGMRGEVNADLREVRGELQGGLRGVRSAHDRDFRITFAAIIAATLGLAWMLAHSLHWL